MGDDDDDAMTPGRRRVVITMFVCPAPTTEVPVLAIPFMWVISYGRAHVQYAVDCNYRNSYYIQSRLRGSDTEEQ